MVFHTFLSAPGASPPRLVDVRPAAARELPLPPIFFPRLNALLLPSDVARPRLALGRRSDLRTVSTVSTVSIVSVVSPCAWAAAAGQGTGAGANRVALP